MPIKKPEKKKPKSAIREGGKGAIYKKGESEFIIPEREKKQLAKQGKFSDPLKLSEEEKKERRDTEIQNTAQKSVDIETAKQNILNPPTTEGEIIPMGAEEAIPETGGKSFAEGETPSPFTEGLEGLQRDIINTENKLAQPETGGVLDTINRWRLEISLANAKEKLRKTEAGELQPYGAVALGTNIGAVTSMGGNAIDGAGRLLGLGRGPQIGGLLGIQSSAINAKNTALTGTWLKRLGFTTKAAVAIGSLIGLTAWGKHVKSEAIEFLPYQISMAREAGDEETARELEQLHAEIADPTGWANIIEEIPGLGVIKAAIDKTRVGKEIIEAQKRRA